MQVSVPWAGILGVLFIGLKLTGYIDWSWVWVLAPFWIPVVIILAIVGMATLAAYILGAEVKFRKWR